MQKFSNGKFATFNYLGSSELGPEKGVGWGTVAEPSCPPELVNHGAESPSVERETAQSWVFLCGLCQACHCRPAAVLHASSGFRKGSTASVCSAHFLNNGFCCRMMHVDSKRAAVTLVSSQQILILVEASRPPGRALRAPLSFVSLLLRQLQHKVVSWLCWGCGVCVCVGRALPT